MTCPPWQTLDDVAFRTALRGWLREHLAMVTAGFPPGTSPHDLDFRRGWEDHLCVSGWSGLSWPVEHGGKGLSLGRQAIFLEEHAASGAPLPLNAIAHGILGPTLIHFGSPAQQRRFLPKILSNEEIWCQGYSEPGAGSDLAALATRAVRDSDVYRVCGQKIWTSFAHIADWCFLLARTDTTAAKHRGISFLLIDMRSPGITVRPIRQMSGEADFNEVFFDDVRVPVENLIGAENDGWRIAMAAASFERGTYFVPRLVRLQAELIELARLAAESGGGRHAASPAIRDRLARSFIDVNVLRLHAHRSLAAAMRGEAPGPESSYIKLLWSEAHQRLLDLAMDVLGRQGALGPQEPSALKHGSWQRDYLWSRAETILAGTSEIQRNIIAERVLGLPRGTA
ncbi:MAG TPA: acyl-CoA dehydrogenase family protein [Aliidongia sp.]|uniref:acyl-CoA dehydrogenase family protein n=1 Tax=Aliidongia sp. TaxID=1914230 RepID=UPI002DDD017B|nr:acyl-CoA dehydrogenase family protein [Aliidongia sp.]HEV2673345.1 acyl-CoA dehydrogenase family protein [Aliidongia sp.]